jgi:hypothetical protein
MRHTALVFVLLTLAGCCCGVVDNYPDNPGTPVFPPPTEDEVFMRSAREDPFLAARISQDGFTAIGAPDEVHLYSVDPETWRDAPSPDDDTAPLANALRLLHTKNGVHGGLQCTSLHHIQAGAWALRMLHDTQEAAECFDPRHVIHFRRLRRDARGGYHEVIMVVCFECDNVAILEPSTDEFQMTYLRDADHTFRDWLNQTLDRAGIKRDVPP